ncbi:MAG: glycine/sarcosine/betaine reductase complex component C subunit beta [Halanaerobiales bacterium]
MDFPVIKGSSYILVHAPNTLKEGGSTQSTTRAKDPDSEYLQFIDDHLRSFEEVVGYAPNQCYIGNILPDELDNIDSPWYDSENLMGDNRFGRLGEIMPEDELYALIQHVDTFDLVKLTNDFVNNVKKKIEDHPILSEMNLNLDGSTDLKEIKEMVDDHKAVPLKLEDEIVGCVKQAHDTDVNLNAHVIYENLISKATAVLSLKNLEDKHALNLDEIDYIIECSEEACGDINQRGGGNFAKAIGEIAGCKNATGSDVRSFCAAPAHAIVNAASLVQSGIYENVVVVAGGSVAKLGMNGKDHVKKDMPIMEDTLGGFAVLVSSNDGVNPVIRTDVIGRHKIGTGSSPQAVISSLVTEPLDENELSIADIDKYSVEMQNPEITKPAGAGDVPQSNYKMIAALGVKRGDIEKKDLMNFVNEHGMPGFAPTQGHIPSGVPFVGHARKMIEDGNMKRAMIIGKGSLFLGRMTNLFDGVSFVMEENTGETADKEKAVDDEEIKGMIADAMRNMAENLLAEE